MLIIALGVLALMVILGTAFASIMRLEKRATENYVEATRMDMLLDSAVDRVVAQLQGAKNFKSFTFYKDAPWLYLIKGEDDLGHGRIDIEDDVQDRVAGAYSSPIVATRFPLAFRTE